MLNFFFNILARSLKRFATPDVGNGVRWEAPIRAQPEMGIYRDNLSATVNGNNLLPIIVIAQNSFDLLITDIAFVIYFVIADKLS